MAVDLDKMRTNSERVAEILKALSHEGRLLMVCFIGDSEKSVQEIEDFVGTSQSNVSQHLAKLRGLDLLATRKEANLVFYHIKDRTTKDLIKNLQRIYCNF